MKSKYLLCFALILSFPQILLAGNGSLHKYWVCRVSTFQSIVGGNTRQGQCRANTAYSEPPCREFVVEFDGINGVKPGVPYQQKSPDNATTRIEINQVNGRYTYSHSIIKAGDKWTYNGSCNAYQAPANEKIYLDNGLNTGL